MRLPLLSVVDDKWGRLHARWPCAARHRGCLRSHLSAPALDVAIAGQRSRDGGGPQATGYPGRGVSGADASTAISEWHGKGTNRPKAPRNRGKSTILVDDQLLTPSRVTGTQARVSTRHVHTPRGGRRRSRGVGLLRAQGSVDRRGQSSRSGRRGRYGRCPQGVRPASVHAGHRPALAESLRDLSDVVDGREETCPILRAGG